MENLYSQHANICSKFYDLLVDSKQITKFILEKISTYNAKKILFIGGFFSVAKELISKGYDIIVADYSDEMVIEGKRRLSDTKIIKSDIRDLPFENEFDAVIVIGRVLTHMFTDDDLEQALLSIRVALKSGGLFLFDNYEDTKITKTNYFNGVIDLKDDKIEIKRDSSTEVISKKPFIVNWKAKYTLIEGTKTINFYDKMKHRAYCREEIKGLLEKNDFKQLRNGDNFDDTSFYTLAQKN